ncbi:uncharacterized protein LOC115661761 [Syzygium oleosum]|uniref:uncharacterized protein LOC115661761 n=1 Tax=Syzygium oleosum TaxID=219896 RepID=UPI0024BA264F|nr:uncharacterized protein LOC115661761 [Syzygium oleosum]
MVLVRSFSSISVLWNKWNTRGFVILSLSLQVFLVLFAPLRKKTPNRPFIFSLWLAYLMADWVAAFTIGLISHNQGNSSTRSTEVDGALQAFWASFLLLHLGGPDTITAFSLEDSLLWRRHLLNLVFQVGRILVLILSILLRLRVSMLSPHRLVGELDERWDRGDKFFEEELNVLGSGYSDTESKLAESIVVKHAYYFFQIFKIFLGDFIFMRQNRKISHEYFHKVSAMDGLRVISVELNFIYEVLHTKALAIRSKQSYLYRFVALSNVVIAFAMFNLLKKHQISILDMKITYMLLFGGITLDMIALFMLVFLDWTIAKIKCYSTGSSKLDSLLCNLVAAMDDLKKPRFATCKVEANADVTYTVLYTPLIFRRWSESIFACNFFSEFLKGSPRKMYTCNRGWGIIPFSNICSFPFRMTKKIISYFHQASETIAKAWGAGFCNYWGISMIPNTKYVSKNPFIKKLWIFIFREVRCKSENADDLAEVMEIFEARVSQPNVVSAVVGTAQLISREMLYELQNYILDASRGVEGLCEQLGEFASAVRETLLHEGIDSAPEMKRPETKKEKPKIEVAPRASHIKGEAHVQVLSKGGELLTFVWLLMAHFGCFYKPGWGIYYDSRFYMYRPANKDDQIEAGKIFEARGAIFLGSILKGIDCSNLLAYVTKANYHSSVGIYILLELQNYLRVGCNGVNVGSNDVKGLCIRLFQGHVKPITSRTLAEGVNLAQGMEGLKDMKWKVMS